ncbi:MAG TPA: hypothetical protein VFE01_05985 [Terracidiphilus sp.]|jgi:hypothetical protein|nr:hypothetical protein [Terracidiphilus sp.]
MATSNPNASATSAAEVSGPGLVVLLASMPPEQREQVLGILATTFPAESLLVATPDTQESETFPQLGIVNIPLSGPSWTLTASDFLNAFQLAGKNEARGILMLGAGAGSLSPFALRDLANAVLTTSADLALPRYDLPPNAGLVNSAILYPLTRALFACRARYPLALDVALSLRMSDRLSAVAQRLIAVNRFDTPIWPVNEGAVNGFTINEFAVGTRELPHFNEPDLNTILPLVTGSLFADIEAKAAFWQRARQAPPTGDPITPTRAPSVDTTVEIAPMLQAFRFAYTNLREIWSLVLPPNTLLGLKRLYNTPDTAAFHMPDNLWSRIVYDFLLSYRLRTINRGHLLGALIPLYLAWVASHLGIVAAGTDPERHIDRVAAAFEIEKPYLVSRWRWPDRFNP